MLELTSNYFPVRSLQQPVMVEDSDTDVVQLLVY